MRNKYNPDYDVKLMLKHLVGLLLLIGVMMSTNGMASLLLLVLLMFYLVMRKPDKLLFVILLGSSLMMMNGVLAPKTTISAAALKVQMLIAAFALFAQIFGHKQTRLLTPLLGIFPYLLFMIVSSNQGWCPIISYLKIFLFSMVFLAYYGCSVQAISSRTVDSRMLRSMFLAITVFFVLGSILVYPFPVISTMSTEEAILSGAASFYRGVTNHSQTLGVLMAIFGSFTFADLVFNIQRADKLYLAILISAFILVYMSASRTAMASLIAGIGISTFFAMQGRGVNRTWRGKVVSAMLGLITIAALSVLAVPSLREKATKFALKYNNEGVSSLKGEDVFATRRGKWDESKYNWQRSPVIGNGFQVVENMKYVKIEGIKDILSAPVEKSTWTWAILEEGGVVGFSLFLIFILTLFFTWMGRRAYVALSVFLVFLMSNFGEFTLFSMSGDGGLLWLLIFLGVVFDQKRLDIQSNEHRFPSGLLDRF